MNRVPDALTIRDLLEQATQLISGPDARLEAEVLLAHVLDRPRSHLLAWPEKVPGSDQQAHFRELVDRRAGGEPVAYLVGEREFWSLPVGVTPATLIPRPETEILVATALEILPSGEHLEVADLGTGSGAIALAIAHERPACRILASDISAAALEVAARNARRLGLNNIEFVKGGWCEALGEQQFDLIVSNPPYIPRHDGHLERGDVRFEPPGALAAGDEGMDDLARIARCARAHLVANGWLMLEHGHDQAAGVRRLLAEHGYSDIQSRRDYSGHERVTGGRQPCL